MANGIRVYYTDDGVGHWHADAGLARNHALEAATALNREVRVSIVNVIIDRNSLLSLLDTGNPVIRRKQIMFIAKPVLRS
jgi:hypothetical protein